MTQRNTPKRAQMLAERAERQKARAPGFTQMLRKPRGHISKDWDPTGDWSPLNRGRLIPAWMNRRTGKPHERRRELLRSGLWHVGRAA